MTNQRFSKMSEMTQHDLLKRSWEEPDEKSRAPFPSWMRSDPMWELETDDFIRAEWRKMSVTEQRGRVMPTGRVQVYESKRNVTIHIPDSEMFSHEIMTIMATAFQLTIFSTDQMRALTGFEPDRLDRLLTRLYRGGYIAKCSGHTAGNFSDIWSFDYKSRVAPAWLNRLPPDIRLLVTGGEVIDSAPPGSMSASSIRHDLVMNELMLRVLELSDNVAGFWGDPFLDAARLYTASDDEVKRASHGDGAIVSKNGKIVMFELVGAGLSGSNWERTRLKAASWAAVAGASGFDISVVFVSLNYMRDWKGLMSAVHKGCNDVGLFTPNSAAIRRGRNKIGVVSASRLMPELGVSSTAVNGIDVWSPWRGESFSALNEPDSTVTGLERAVPTINTVAALHTPRWLHNELVDRNEKLLVRREDEDS